MSTGIEKEENRQAGSAIGADAGRKSSRRGFLVGAGAAAGVAGAAAIALKSGTAPVVAGEAAVEAAQKAPVQGRGYHETAHIRKYYDTTKV